jgi:hypothetical protein
MDEIRYPLGKFAYDAAITEEKRREVIRGIAEMPAALRRAVQGLGKAELDTPYREGGWTPRQIVHHLADSHMNAFIRIKLALTEERPSIKPYNQETWALTTDSLAADPALSLALLDGLHARWAALLSALTAVELQRTFTHPERGLLTVDYNLQMYGWHGRHHTAQITALRARKGWG